MNVKETVAGFFREKLRRDIDPDADVFELGLVDSLFAMQLVALAEDRLDIAVERGDLDIDNFRSINALAAFVERKRGMD